MTQRATPPQDRLEIFDVLDRIEALTSSATKLPLTRRAVINPRDIQELVERLRRLVPLEITEAQQIIHYRDSFVLQAQTDAKRVRSTADAEAIKKISDTQVMYDARKAAEQIEEDARRRAEQAVIDAETQAQARVEGADAYAMDVLRRLEEELGTLLGTARRGLESLSEGRELREDDDGRR
jgi:hypothetical protein